MKHYTILYLGLLLFTSGIFYAQQGIGTNMPNPSAALQIVSPDKGLLIPRVSLTSSSTFAPLTGTSSSTHNGMMVWNTNSSIANGLTGIGFYYWENHASIAGQGTWHRLTAMVDLSGINTDEQNIDALTFDSATNLLTVGITGGTSQTISLASLAHSGTDSQTLAYGSSATSTQTTLEISDGNSLSLQASGSLSFTQTGTNTLELTVTPTDTTKIIDTDGDTQIQIEEGNDDDTIRFDTAGTERMIIDDSGNVGIGVGSPTYTLDINGTHRVVSISDGTSSRNPPTVTRAHNSDNLQDGPDYTDENAIIYTTFTTGSNITRNQIIYETGGSGTGSVFGINGGNFEVYAGSAAAVQISTSVLANTPYSAAIVYDLTGNELRLYLKTEAGAIIQSSDLVATNNSFTDNDWAGNDSTGVGDENGTNKSSYSGNLSFAGTGLSQIDLYQTNNIDDINSVVAGESLPRFVVNDSGNVGIGTESPTHSLTVSGTAQVTGAFHDASGDAGTAGQLLSSTGIGLNWIDAPLSNTDSQTLSASLQTNTLTLVISNGNSQTIDLSSINTDEQNIDGLAFDSATSSLTVGITGGTSQTISLASLAHSGTDSQTLAYGSSATSTQTTLEISDGNSLSLQASGSLSFTQTGTNTLELAVTPNNVLRLQTLSTTATPSTQTTLLILTPTADMTVNLPATTTYSTGFVLRIHRNQGYTGTNDSIILDPSGTETLDGQATRTLNVGFQSLTIVNTGSSWVSIN